jgi:hypothetical protein
MTHLQSGRTSPSKWDDTVVSAANRETSPTAQVPKLFGPVYATASARSGSLRERTAHDRFSSNRAANGRSIRCAERTPFPRSRRLTLRAPLVVHLGRLGVDQVTLAPVGSRNRGAAWDGLPPSAGRAEAASDRDRRLRLSDRVVCAGECGADFRAPRARVALFAGGSGPVACSCFRPSACPGRTSLCPPRRSRWSLSRARGSPCAGCAPGCEAASSARGC